MISWLISSTYSPLRKLAKAKFSLADAQIFKPTVPMSIDDFVGSTTSGTANKLAGEISLPPRCITVGLLGFDARETEIARMAFLKGSSWGMRLQVALPDQSYEVDLLLLGKDHHAGPVLESRLMFGRPVVLAYAQSYWRHFLLKRPREFAWDAIVGRLLAAAATMGRRTARVG